MAAKIPLAIRKSRRDEWENKKPELETKLSSLLGTTWTFNFDGPALYAYAVETKQFNDDSKHKPGSMLHRYAKGAIDGVEEFLKKFGDDGKNELNTLAATHEVTLSADEAEKWSSGGGCDITDGKFRLLFNKTNLGSYAGEIAQYLDQAVNNASTVANPIGLVARQSIKKDFDPKIGAIKDRLISVLQVEDFKFDPNFEANYEALVKAGTAVRSGWESRFGEDALNYFDTLVKAMETDGFGKDEMLREGFQEAVEMNKVALRATEDLKLLNYNEIWVDQGVLYLQTKPGYWGSYVDDIGSIQKLVDLL